jgi:hypothetical protein
MDMEGHETPIAVFSLGLGALAGAAVPAVTAGVEAATAAVPPAIAGISAAVPPAIAGVQAATAALPAAVAGIDAASGLVPPAVAAAAEAIGTTPGLIASAAPELFGGVETLAQGVAGGGSNLAQTVAQGVQGAGAWTPMNLVNELRGVADPVINAGPNVGNVGPWKQVGTGIREALNPVRPPLLPPGVSQVASTASSAPSVSAPSMTPEQVMAQFRGPQMSTDPVTPTLEQLWATPAPNMSTPTGPAYSGAMPTMPSRTPADPWYKSDFAKSAAKNFSSSLTEFGDDQQKPSQARAQREYTAAPPLNPYESEHRSAQLDFAKSIMEDYMSGGGYG